MAAKEIDQKNSPPFEKHKEHCRCNDSIQECEIRILMKLKTGSFGERFEVFKGLFGVCKFIQ